MNLFQAWSHWISGDELSGETIVCAVWCWKLLVWARWGKIVQLISAMVIVADIVGPERIRKFGKSLNSLFSLNRAKQYLTRTLRWVTVFFKPLIEDMKMQMQMDDLLGKISREETEKLLAEYHTKMDSEPYTRQEFEDFISYILRVFKLSLLDKLNVSFSLVGIALFWMPLASKIYYFNLIEVLEHPYMGKEPLEWYSYLLPLGMPLIVVFLGFIVNLLFLSPVMVTTIIIGLTIVGTLFDVVIIDNLAWLLERPKVENWIRVISLILLLVGFHFDLLAS